MCWGGGWGKKWEGKKGGGGKPAFHKGAVTFSDVKTRSPLSPAFARRRIPFSNGEEKKVSGKNFAGTPSLSSRDVFRQEERAGRLALSTQIHITKRMERLCVRRGVGGSVAITHRVGCCRLTASPWYPWYGWMDVLLGDNGREAERGGGGRFMLGKKKQHPKSRGEISFWFMWRKVWLRCCQVCSSFAQFRALRAFAQC